MNVGTLEDAYSSGASQRMFGSGQEWWWGGHQGSVTLVALYLKWCTSEWEYAFYLRVLWMSQQSILLLFISEHLMFNISAWPAIRFMIRFNDESIRVTQSWKCAINCYGLWMPIIRKQWCRYRLMQLCNKYCGIFTEMSYLVYTFFFLFFFKW